MKGFYWGTGVARCGFCRTQGHNITTCKRVTMIATKAMHNLDTIPNYILSRDEYDALYELKRREERKAQKPRKKRKRPECSYCKSCLHQRPKCKSLKDFKQLVYKANKNWKRLFARRVNECGLGVGALIKMRADFVKNLNFKLEPNGIAMITGYSTNDLSVFCALDIYSQYQGNSTFQIMSGERTDNVSVKFLSTILHYNLLTPGWWYNETPPKVLCPMHWEPNDEWINQEWDEVMNWFFKDVNELNLNNSGIMSFIKNWANKV